MTTAPLVSITRTGVFLWTGARCWGKFARGGRSYAQLGSSASDCDSGTDATFDREVIETALDSADTKRAGRGTLRCEQTVSCICDSGVLRANGGVRSSWIMDGICDAKWGSKSSLANRRRFLTRPISRLSALDSAFSLFGSSVGG